jgi:hypothetical protein
LLSINEFQVVFTAYGHIYLWASDVDSVIRVKCAVGEEAGYGLSTFSTYFAECGDFRDFVGEGHEAEKLAKGLSESVAVEAGHYDMLAVDLDRF